MALLEHPGHAAVLYRTRAQVDILASALRSAGVPNTTHGHADLFRQRVVRDILAYLRLAYNPGGRLAMARALDAPPRGLARLAAVLVDEPATTTQAALRMAEQRHETRHALATWRPPRDSYRAADLPRSAPPGACHSSFRSYPFQLLSALARATRCVEASSRRGRDVRTARL